MSKGSQIFNHNKWRRTFGSKASIPERKVICAAAKATTRLRRICTCSCLKSLDMKAKRKVELRSITILQNGRSPITFVLIFWVSSNFIIYASFLCSSIYKLNWEKRALSMSCYNFYQSEFWWKRTHEIGTQKCESLSRVLLSCRCLVFQHNLRRNLTCVDILTLTWSMQ